MWLTFTPMGSPLAGTPALLHDVWSEPLSCLLLNGRTVCFITVQGEILRPEFNELGDDKHQEALYARKDMRGKKD